MHKIYVWDLPVRLFHWLLVLALVAAWYTSDGERGLIDWHLRIGYFILGLVVYRLFWGFLGTYYAKFSQFFPSLDAIKAYIRGNKTSYIGHNPLGALMVFAMLALLLLQAISGLFMTDDIFTSGPYFDSASKEVQKLMATLHHWCFDLIIAFSVIHIFAIGYYQLIKKEQLVKAMVFGFKVIETHSKLVAKVGHSKWLRAIVLAILVVGFVYWLVVINPPVSEEFYY